MILFHSLNGVKITATVCVLLCLKNSVQSNKTEIVQIVIASLPTSIRWLPENIFVPVVLNKKVSDNSILQVLKLVII